MTTNREWLYGLDVADLAAWFDAEHEDTFAEQARMHAAKSKDYEWRAPTANRPIGQSDARETPETAETDTSKCDIRDFDDSREKLEADVRKHYTHTVSTAMWPPSANKHTDVVSVSIDTVFEWLDRQAAMTERYWRGQVDALAAKGDQLAEANAELRAKLDELEAEASGLVGQIGDVEGSLLIEQRRSRELREKLSQAIGHASDIIALQDLEVRL